jgi:hypothetical protein
MWGGRLQAADDEWRDADADCNGNTNADCGGVDLAATGTRAAPSASTDADLNADHDSGVVSEGNALGKPPRYAVTNAYRIAAHIAGCHAHHISDTDNTAAGSDARVFTTGDHRYPSCRGCD